MWGWLIRVTLKQPPSHIPTQGYVLCSDFVTSAEVWRDGPGEHWGQKAPGRSRALQAASEPAATQGLGAHSAEPPYWTIPYWTLQQGKGYPGQPLVWGTFTVTCIFCSIIWRGKATLRPFFFHVLCNMRVSCNSCCSPPWQQYLSEMGTATIPV